MVAFPDWETLPWDRFSPHPDIVSQRLATLLRLPEGGPQVAVVVLGAKSNAGRFWETRHLFNWLSNKASELFGKDQQE